MFFLDVGNAAPWRLATGTAGAYGPPESRKMRGRFIVVCTAPIVLVDGSKEFGELKQVAADKLELPFDPETSRLQPVLLSSGVVTLAARGAQAALAWLVPLVDGKERC